MLCLQTLSFSFHAFPPHNSLWDKRRSVLSKKQRMMSLKFKIVYNPLTIRISSSSSSPSSLWMKEFWDSFTTFYSSLKALKIRRSRLQGFFEALRDKKIFEQKKVSQHQTSSSLKTASHVAQHIFTWEFLCTFSERFLNFFNICRKWITNVLELFLEKSIILKPSAVGARLLTQTFAFLQHLHSKINLIRTLMLGEA